MAYNAFVAYSKDIYKRPFLICCGSYGSGKTYLIEALAVELYNKGIFCRVLTFSEMLSVLKAGMEKGAIPSYEARLELYKKAKILLIDDVGMGAKETEWNTGVLEAIVDYRYHERLPLVITSNNDKAGFSPRITSRFTDKEIAQIVINRGQDYRRSK